MITIGLKSSHFNLQILCKAKCISILRVVATGSYIILQSPDLACCSNRLLHNIQSPEKTPRESIQRKHLEKIQGKHPEKSQRKHPGKTPRENTQRKQARACTRKKQQAEFMRHRKMIYQEQAEFMKHRKMIYQACMRHKRLIYQLARKT
jgi:hypothetical protein